MAGRVLTVWQAKAAVSSSNTTSDRSWPWWTGARESVSAMERSLPGTSDIKPHDEDEIFGFELGSLK